MGVTGPCLELIVMRKKKKQATNEYSRCHPSPRREKIVRQGQ